MTIRVKHFGVPYVLYAPKTLACSMCLTCPTYQKLLCALPALCINDFVVTYLPYVLYVPKILACPTFPVCSRWKTFWRALYVLRVLCSKNFCMPYVPYMHKILAMFSHRKNSKRIILTKFNVANFNSVKNS